MLTPRTALAIGWFLVAWATVCAVGVLGFGSAGDIFLADLGSPWRGRFNIDFLALLALVALWLGWMAERPWFGLIVGLSAVLGGVIFSFDYLLARSFDGDSNLSRLLLGRQHRPARA